MKKLKLSLSNLDGVELLSRTQLKEIMGGESGSGCNSRCSGTCSTTCGGSTVTGTCRKKSDGGCACASVC